MNTDKTIKELDVIKIQGTVVAVYKNGEAVEVEIVSKKGDTLALFTLKTEGLDYDNR